MILGWCRYKEISVYLGVCVCVCWGGLLVTTILGWFWNIQTSDTTHAGIFKSAWTYLSVSWHELKLCLHLTKVFKPTLWATSVILCNNHMYCYFNQTQAQVHLWVRIQSHPALLLVGYVLSIFSIFALCTHLSLFYFLACYLEIIVTLQYSTVQVSLFLNLRAFLTVYIFNQMQAQNICGGSTGTSTVIASRLLSNSLSFHCLITYTTLFPLFT